MKISDLIPGATYWIESVDESGKPWEGSGKFVAVLNEGGYPSDTLFFTHEDDEEGYFAIHEVKKLIKKAKPVTVADRIVQALERDITDRKGLKHEWYQIDSVVKAEIRRTWVKIIEKELKAL